MVCEKCELKLKHVVTPDPWSMGGSTKTPFNWRCIKLFILNNKLFIYRPFNSIRQELGHIWGKEDQREQSTDIKQSGSNERNEKVS